MASAAAFLTPVATPANLMVMGPGGYRFGDYWKLGLPIRALFGVVAVFLVPVICRSEGGAGVGFAARSTTREENAVSTLRDDEIQTIEDGKRFDPQADADGDDTDGTDGDSDDTDGTDGGDADADDSDAA